MVYVLEKLLQFDSWTFSNVKTKKESTHIVTDEITNSKEFESP